MTWNIHGGIGPDGVLDMDRTLALIRRHKPDILAVQEVESRGRGLDHCGFSLLRDHIPGHSRPAETIQAHDGAYGHMLLSRWPIEHSELHDLSHPGREPRIAIEARIATPAGELRVVSAHLGLRHRERQQQAAKLAALVRRGSGPMVAMGDFNEWSWRGPVWRALGRQMPGHTRLRTFPARFPALKLDRIFCRPASLLGRNWSDRDGRHASDHLPIVAELHMPVRSAP
ncbi:endonuclease/exonuclease/phosphatase family protein [Roseomonas haemaphysalidis]|nr:endonuclease/exonuclease/phosphatase family protein [Roseomonas haemaphysalidis]